MENDQIFDQVAAAEIERLKANPAEHESQDQDVLMALYALAFNPPDEDPEAGKLPTAEATASAAGTTEGAPDLAALAKDTGLPGAAVRETFDKFQGDPEVARVDAELDGLDIPEPERKGYVTDFYKALVADAKGTIDPQKTEAALRRKWGTSYGENMAAANFAVNRLGLKPYLAQTQAFDDVRVITHLAKIGAVLLPPRAEYFKITGDPTHPANNPGHKDHEAALEQLERLTQKVYGRRDQRSRDGESAG